MKIIGKTKAILIANKAETMIEVVVAFLVMTIVLALFAQGMRYAATAQNFAMEKTRDTDKALKCLQNTVAGKTNPADVAVNSSNVDDKDLNINSKKMLKLTKHRVTLQNGGDTNTFYYYVYDADPSE